MKTALLVAVCMVLACGTAFGDEPCGGLWGWNGARVGHDGLGLWWEWWPTDGFAFVSPAVRDVISGSVDETDSAWVVLHNGSVWFMGSEDYAPEQVKRQVGSTVGVFANAKSISHPLVLDADGDVWQIGANMVATKISGLSGIKKVVAAREQYLALNTMGKAYAWGNNSGGQCGVGSDAEVIAGPQLVDETWGLNGVVMDIAASGWHSVFVLSDGTVWTAGWNDGGELDGVVEQYCDENCPGDGNHLPTCIVKYEKSESPIQVPMDYYRDAFLGEQVLDHVVSAVAGAGWSAALDASGKVWVWGIHFKDQHDAPWSLHGLRVLTYGISQIAAGQYQLAAIPTYSYDCVYDTTFGGYYGFGLPISVPSAQAVFGGPCSDMFIAIGANPTIQFEVVLDSDWVYTNRMVNTQDRHKVSIGINFLPGSLACDHYEMQVVEVFLQGGIELMQEAIVDSANLAATMSGGRLDSGVERTGEAWIAVRIIGLDESDVIQGASQVVVRVDVRKLGDVDGNGWVQVSDMGILNYKLNGGTVPGIEDRAFDIDGNGYITTSDLWMLNAILNGIPLS